MGCVYFYTVEDLSANYSFAYQPGMIDQTNKIIVPGSKKSLYSNKMMIETCKSPNLLLCKLYITNATKNKKSLINFFSGRVVYLMCSIFKFDVFYSQSHVQISFLNDFICRK